jgi:hypothetical protein
VQKVLYTPGDLHRPPAPGMGTACRSVNAAATVSQGMKDMLKSEQNARSLVPLMEMGREYVTGQIEKLGHGNGLHFREVPAAMRWAIKQGAVTRRKRSDVTLFCRVGDLPPIHEAPSEVAGIQISRRDVVVANGCASSVDVRLIPVTLPRAPWEAQA